MYRHAKNLIIGKTVATAFLHLVQNVDDAGTLLVGWCLYEADSYVKENILLLMNTLKQMQKDLNDKKDAL